MTNKEILAELKRSYKYMHDIRENGCNDYSHGQLGIKYINRIEHLQEEISNLYFDIWNMLFNNGEDLRIPSKYQIDKKYTILIGNSISTDYTLQNNDTGELDEDIVTCDDLKYYWFFDMIWLHR